MEFDHRIHQILAADRVETLRASYGAAGPLRLRLGLRLVSLGERLVRPYACPPAPATAGEAR